MFDTIKGFPPLGHKGKNNILLSFSNLYKFAFRFAFGSIIHIHLTPI